MKVWVKAAVSVGLLALLFYLLPLNQVREAVSRMPGRVWLGVLGLFALGHMLGVQKWRLLLQASRGRISYFDALRCYGAGLFANLCLPSIVGGDVLRAMMAGRLTGRMEAAFLSSIMDRVIDVATLAILITAGALTARTALHGWSGEVLTAAFVIGIGLGLLAIPFVLRRPLAAWPKRLRRPVGRALVALRHLAQRPASAAMALTISITIQSLFVLLNVWIGGQIGITLALPLWFMAWPLAKVAGLMPISLGGLAVRDATFGALLVPLGVPMARGVVAALVWQTVMIAGGLLGGVSWWLLSRRRAGGASFRDLLAPAREHG
ncbi:MAG TPA: lysylphosphatidylglycerol synthase transmembrane domain-containing protein [Gemmatimonadales bacterium]|jgi:uncharacterized membrane protein YbhN (UPF0104 family)